MKKLFTILTVVALATTTSFAQISVKAGTNLSNMSTNVDQDNSMKVGMIFGANYRLGLSDAMSLDMSVAYKQSGAQNSASATVGGVTTEVTGTVALDYLDISPMLSFNLADAFSLSVGPYIAFAVSGNNEVDVTVSGGTSSQNGTVSASDPIEFGEIEMNAAGTENVGGDGYKAMDFGINIGATYFITEAIGLSAGYSLGLNDLGTFGSEIEAAYEAANYELPSAKNSGIYVSVGYSFGG